MDHGTLTILAVMGIAALSLIITPILTWILSRQKEKALEALKAYAEAGREPPPELLKAISSNLDVWGMGDASAWSGMGVGGKWANAFMPLGLAAGFGIAAFFSHYEFSHPFWIVTFVAGGFGIVALIYALFTSSHRQ